MQNPQIYKYKIDHKFNYTTIQRNTYTNILIEKYSNIQMHEYAIIRRYEHIHLQIQNTYASVQLRKVTILEHTNITTYNRTITTHTHVQNQIFTNVQL